MLWDIAVRHGADDDALLADDDDERRAGQRGAGVVELLRGDGSQCER